MARIMSIFAIHFKKKEMNKLSGTHNFMEFHWIHQDREREHEAITQHLLFSFRSKLFS